MLLTFTRKQQTAIKYGNKLQYKSLFLGGLVAIIVLFLIPRLLLGENSYVTIHDNLDSELVWRMIMTEGGRLIGDDALTQRIMNGFPARLFPSQLNVTVWLFLFLSPFKAYVANELLVHAFAFTGMFLLLQHHLLPQSKYRFLVLGVAFTFAALPFFSVYGLSIAGMPLLLYAFLNLRNNDGTFWNYLIPVFYAFYSSLPLTGFFVLVVLAVWFIVQVWQTRKVPVQFLGGAIVLGLSFVVTEHNLLYTMFLDPGYVSHRTAFEATYRYYGDIKSVVEKAAENFVFGNYHAVSVHRPILLAAVIALVISWKNKAYSSYGAIMKGLVVAFLLSCIFAIYNSYLLVDLKNSVEFIRTFNISRFFWFHPLVWFVVFTFALKAILDHAKWGRTIVASLLALQLIFCLGSTTDAFNEFRVNSEFLLAKVTGKSRLDQSHFMSYKAFYSEELFQEIEDFIGEPQQNYRVVCIAMHPSIAQYNGFYTLDGYQNNYPLEYKLKFRKIIGKELAKNSYWQNYYDGWGSRFHVLSSEMAAYYDNVKSKNLEIHNLELNTAAFREMGGRYILSAVKVNNPEDSALKLLKVFEHPDSQWRIYLYATE